MIDFASVRGLAIPEGDVVQIADSFGQTIWQRFVNLVSTSIAKDGSIYNGVGYRDNYDIQSSTGNERARSGSVITGFIPIEVGAKIYIKNGFWGSSGTAGFYCSFTVYDENFNFLNGSPGQDSVGAQAWNFSTYIPSLYSRKVGQDPILEVTRLPTKEPAAKYYRLSLKKTAEAKDLIITHNEEV